MMGGTVLAVSSAWATVRSLDEFADLRHNQLTSSPVWWPDLGPLADAGSFSFAHRTGRVGPVTLLEVDFHDGVWVNGGESRPHYQVSVPLAAASAATGSELTVTAALDSPGIYRPEGKAAVSRYVGRLLAVMIDRHAVEDAVADALGHPVTSQIDFHSRLVTTTAAARGWLAMVGLLSDHLFRPGNILHQPLVGLPFAESVVRGLLLAADHPYRAALDGQARAAPPRAIRAAIEVIEAEAHRPLTVSGLAARSYVSVRSLQQGFRAHLGTTPMAYLREVRLHRARQDLLHADPSIDTVASLAFRWGFTNLGRFAAAYAARYGENPGTTLRRSATGSVSRQTRALA
jgi:AraC-like DNA-binding protein